MRFRFRLETLLRLRRHRESQARTALGVAIQCESERNANEKQAREREARAARDLALRTASGVMARDLVAAQVGVETLRARRVGFVQAGCESQAQVAARRTELVRARADREALTRLRLRAESEHRRAMAKREQRGLDDLAGQRAWRSRTAASGSRALLLALGMLLWSPPPAIAEASPAGQTENVDISAPARGVEQLARQLRRRERALDLQARTLGERERAAVELERIAVERIAALETMRSELEERIERWTQKDGDRSKRLAKIYAAMPPAKAASLLEELELDLAVAVLQRIKGKQSAALLTSMGRDRALAISRRLLKPLGAAKMD